MLKVDLAQLERRRRAAVEAEVAPAELGIGEEEARFDGPVRVQLEAQQAGADVLVRGSIEATAEVPCRRCLQSVRRSLVEDVTWLFREDAEAADAEDVLPLPPRVGEVDLIPAVREQLLLAVPPYVVCEEACRGLCPGCGVNLNEAACTCEPEVGDDRWAALRRLKSE